MKKISRTIKVSNVSYAYVQAINGVPVMEDNECLVVYGSNPEKLARSIISKRKDSRSFIITEIKTTNMTYSMSIDDFITYAECESEDK